MIIAHIFFLLSFCGLFSKENYLQSEILSHFEIQRYVDQHWLANRKLIDGLDACKIMPRLFLYSKIDADVIESYSQIASEIKQSLGFNEKLQQHVASLGPSKYSLHDLRLQKIELQIALNFHQSLLLRKQHRFLDALKEIEEGLELIELYQKEYDDQPSNGFKQPQDLFALAYYHKGKIHRMLAGYHLDDLEASQLEQCEKCYKQALDRSVDNPVIFSSLGFLYNDMSRHEEALKYHLLANQLYPNYPDYIHGVAYAYYNVQQLNARNDQPLLS